MGVNLWSIAINIRGVLKCPVCGSPQSYRWRAEEYSWASGKAVAQMKDECPDHSGPWRFWDDKDQYIIAEPEGVPHYVGEVWEPGDEEDRQFLEDMEKDVDIETGLLIDPE